VPAQNLLHTLCEGLAHIAAVAQQTLHPCQPAFAALESLQCPFAIRHLGGAHRHRMGQTDPTQSLIV
jgi:hypothetical protein